MVRSNNAVYAPLFGMEVSQPGESIWIIFNCRLKT